MIVLKIAKVWIFQLNFLPVKKNKKKENRGCSHPLDQVTRLKLNDGKYGRHMFKSRSASLLPLHHGGMEGVKIT